MADEWPYRYEIVPLDRFFVDPAYQREVKKIALKIEREYDPSLVGTLTANERKGRGRAKLALIDGQQRWTGATNRGEPVLPAVVFEGLTPEQEADLFARLQSERTNITTLENFKAKLAAKNPTALAIKEIAEQHGYTIGQQHNGLRAMKALQGIHERGNLARVLRIVGQAWPDVNTNESCHASILRGVEVFIRERDRDGGLDEARLVSRLARVDPATIRLRADHLRQGRGSGNNVRMVTEAILAEYLKRG